MSMHNIELTELEKIGLENHHLPVGRASQLSDCFRLGMRWAAENREEDGKVAEQHSTILDLQKDVDDLQECFDTCYGELTATRDSECKLSDQLNRLVTFVEKHIEKWVGVRELEPSLQVLRRGLPKNDK